MYQRRKNLNIYIFSLSIPRSDLILGRSFFRFSRARRRSNRMIAIYRRARRRIMIRRRVGRERARRRARLGRRRKTTDLFKRANKVIFMDVSFLSTSEVFVFRETILSFVGVRRGIRAGTNNIKIYRVVRRIFSSRWNIAVLDIRGFLRTRLLLLFFRLKSTCSLRLWCFTHHATSSFGTSIMVGFVYLLLAYLHASRRLRGAGGRF